METGDSTQLPLRRGDWKYPDVTDLRSPCPIINSLANHGYIARDGRNITADEIIGAFQEVLGLAPDVAYGLTKPPYTLHTEQEPPQSDTEPTESQRGWFHGFLRLPNLPTADSQSGLGLRDAGQVNEKGEPVLNLTQLSRHGAVEHDVSLVRRDFAQGDNTSVQPDLVNDFLAACSDGKTFTIADFAHFRNQRLEQQKRDNPELKFGLREAILAFGEVALIMSLWGGSVVQGYGRVPLEYVKAIFKEERFPFQEGWKKRLIPLTIPELLASSTALQGSALYDHTIGHFRQQGVQPDSQLNEG